MTIWIALLAFVLAVLTACVGTLLWLMVILMMTVRDQVKPLVELLKAVMDHNSAIDDQQQWRHTDYLTELRREMDAIEQLAKAVTGLMEERERNGS